ncbi:unnamed protein product [Fusarium venenatum]|uniref:Uncharacterized protein n=1 Tax=Fusarium venenatum TaxID=56646 RepID=A0A2L2SQX5_9HYPO|nr:LOW QUALITY PROTEIN: uncharacterized protein FVRRES_12101 [Fusarium venenatum]CEI39410.1 unnamed protein product [Fusarium venenatum]
MLLGAAVVCAALPGQPIGEQRHAQAVSSQFTLQQRQQTCPCMIVTVYEEYVPGIMGPERLRKSQDGNKHSLVDIDLETCLSSGGLRRMKKKLHVLCASLCRPALILIHYDPSRQTRRNPYWVGLCLSLPSLTNEWSHVPS